MPRRCRSRTVASTPDTIAFGIRNVPRIERGARAKPIGCSSPAGVSVPGILLRRCARSRRALRLLFVQRHSGARARGRGRRRGLSLSGRIDPPLSQARSPSPTMIRARRLPPRVVSGDDRRHRRAAFRLAFSLVGPRVISALAHLPRLARAGFVFAREGVFGMVDTGAAAGRRARGVAARASDRAADRDGAATRLSAALTRLGPTYVKLGQFLATRPDIVGAALARDLETLQDKMAPFPQAEAEAAVEKAFGRPLRRFSSSSARRSRPPRSRRCIAPRSRRRRAAAGRGQGAAARHRAALQAPTSMPSFRRPQRRAAIAGGAAAAPDRGGGDAGAVGRDRDGFPAGSGGALGDGGEYSRRSRFPRAAGRLGAHRAGRADAGMGRRRRRCPTAPRSRRKVSISSSSAAR